MLLARPELPSGTIKVIDVRRWTLECSHTIVCGCFHFIGQRVYCSTCSKHVLIRRWEMYESGNVPDSSAQAAEQ